MWHEWNILCSIVCSLCLLFLLCSCGMARNSSVIVSFSSSEIDTDDATGIETTQLSAVSESTAQTGNTTGNSTSASSVFSSKPSSGTSTVRSTCVTTSVATPTSEPKSIYEASVISEGNRSRITVAMRRAQKGENVTVAAIGGSITEGEAATSVANQYVTLVADWWKKTFQKSQITYVNAGIGATDSILGASRVKKDVLTQKPDFVLVEFAVNDTSDSIMQEAYDGMVRQILKSEKSPGVMLLFMADNQYHNVENSEIIIGAKYQLPMISFREAMLYRYKTENKSIADYLADVDHPTNEGHKQIAALIIHELESVYASLDKISTTIPPLAASPTDGRFGYTTWISPVNAPVSNTGWVKANGVFAHYNQGWTTTKKGAVISYNITGSVIYFVSLYQTDRRAGKVGVDIDGKRVAVIDADFAGGFSTHIHLDSVLNTGIPAPHRVDITFLNEVTAGSTGEVFTFLGLIVAEQ